MGNFSLWCEWAASTWFGLLHGEKYDKEWDEVLGRALDDPNTVISCEDGQYTVMVGSAEVWVANRFYSYGTCRGEWSYKDTGRPSIKTMIRLAAVVDPIIREAMAREAQKKQDRLRALVK